jgi:hypothetical protein
MKPRKAAAPRSSPFNLEKEHKIAIAHPAETQTTKMLDFYAKSVPKSRNFKPETTRETKKLLAQTTSRTHFLEWPASKPLVEKEKQFNVYF